MRKVSTCMLLSAVLMSARAPCAAAQGAPQSTGSATLSGVVSDVDGRPLAGVYVDVSGVKKHATTDERGKFRIDKLPTDSLVMITRRVGLVPMMFDLLLVPGENTVTVTMEQIPQRLDAVRNEVEQTGLFGVVADTGFSVLDSASVSTVVHKASTYTNDKGQFFFDPVQPGADLVDVRKFGYRPRMVSFTMPPKGGQRVGVWLTPLPSGLDARAMRRASMPSNALMQELFDFGQRRRWASSARSMFATREQLAQYASGMNADDALRYLPRFGTVRPSEIDCVIVDGTMAAGFFDQYNTNEMETLEIASINVLTQSERSRCASNGTDTRSAASRMRQHWVAFIMLRH